MEQLKVDLNTLYQQNTGKSLPIRFLNFWVSSLNESQKTMDDFRKFVTDTEDYKSYKQTQFKDKFYQRIGLNEFSIDMYDKFMINHKDTVITEMMMDEYITGMQQFHDKYSRVIQKVFTLVKPTETLTDQILQFYLKRFRQNDYSVHSFENDLTSNLHTCEECKTHDINHLGNVTPVNTIVPLVEQTINNELISRFEVVFKRPMFVQEYMKYNQDTGFDEMRTFEKHQKQYTIMKDLHNTFMEHKLNEYEFVKQYLSCLDDSSFVKNFVTQTVNTSEYERNMKRLIQNKFQEMFDEVIEADDINYVFVKIKHQTLSLVDEEIPNILVNFKRETDEIVRKIYSLFDKTLCRHPDEIELEKYIISFRECCENGFAAAELKLEKELLMSIEYHDILKKHIKNIYFKKHASEILPSNLFKLLAKAIDMVKDWNLCEVEDRITQLVAL